MMLMLGYEIFLVLLMVEMMWSRGNASERIASEVLWNTKRVFLVVATATHFD